MKSIRIVVLACLITLVSVVGSVVNAQGVRFDMLTSTPAGSWQLREDTTTDRKGRQTVTSTRTTMLGKESRNGQDHYWIEMVIQGYKVKKGKRKATGKPMIVKSLMSASILNADAANVMTNLRGLSAEMIVQNGNDDPMRVTGSGGFLAGLMKGLGAEINYKFEDQGTEKVTVSAGSFDAKKIHGGGTTEMKIIVRKMKIKSESTVWLADTVPFGMVKSVGYSTTNGKRSEFVNELLEYGMSGGASLITKQPRDMPNLTNPFAK